MEKITLRRISRVRIGAIGLAVVSAGNSHNENLELTIPATEIVHLAVPLLCVAAVEAAGQEQPVAGTEVSGGLLPVKSWKTGQADFNKEPTLTLAVAGGELQFKLPGRTAIEMGKALIQAGEAAMVPPAVKPG
jgi:hypothetical protein